MLLSALSYFLAFSYQRTKARDENMKRIEEMIKELPPELRQEVQDFVEFLIEKGKKRTKRARNKPKFDWAGALKDLKDQHTSVGLQHKISDWRAGDK